MEIKGNKAVITFDHVGAGLYSFDVRDPKGLPYADRQKFVWANARIVGKISWKSGRRNYAFPSTLCLGGEPCLHLMSREGLPPRLSVLMISRW